MMLARLAAVSLAALVLPGVATAGLTSIRAHELVPQRAGVAVAGRQERFDLVGVQWRGPGRVELRTRSLAGTWSPWHDAAPEEEDRPDPGSREARLRGWRLGSPWWAGPSDRVQVRTHGRVLEVRTWTVRSVESRLPLRRLTSPGQPDIVPRSAWGADESIRRAPPAYAPELRYAVVHHTAGKNAYTRAEVPAILRGIQLYHVKANGWNDIGYNALIDRFGTVYEGRYGGIDRNVVGAHAVGFNTGSVGVALLGTYEGTQAPAAAEKALARYLAWRLDLAHVDPGAMLTVSSGGSPKYAAGVPVLLRAVSGHRDVGLTACPGATFYGRLGAVGAEARRTGLPKLYESVATAEGTAAAFHARLSGSLPWTVTVTDAQGTQVASGSGAGTAIDWTWDASTVPAGEYGWRMDAGSGSSAVTPATGTLTAGAAETALALSDARAEPALVSPNGDGVADTATIAYTLTAPATVGAVALDAAGAEAAVVEQPTWRRAGEHQLVLDASALADGAYTIRLDARTAAGDAAAATVPVTVTRTLGRLALTPALVSPNGDGRADALRAAFTLTRPATVTVRVLRGTSQVAVLLAGPRAAGRQVIRWDGSKPDGTIRDGSFTLAVDADDGSAVAHAELPFASDVTAPHIRLVSRTPARIAVSEAVSLRVTVNGATRRLRTDAAATIRIPGVTAIATLRATAWDRAGNAAALTVKRPRQRAK